MRAKKPLTPEESKFLEHTDDFVALADGQETGWLDGVVEDTMAWCIPSNVMKVCKSASHLQSFSGFSWRSKDTL